MSPGNRAIFRLKYQITAQAASSGLVANQLKVNATGPVNPDTSTFTEVSDLSEDPEDASFDPLVNQDNNTITLLSAVKSMKVEKRVEAQDTNNDGVIEAGDKLVYTITVENDGEVNLFSLILEDTIYDDDTASDPSNEVTDLTVTHSYGNSSINLNI